MFIDLASLASDPSKQSPGEAFFLRLSLICFYVCVWVGVFAVVVLVLVLVLCVCVIKLL